MLKNIQIKAFIILAGLLFNGSVFANNVEIVNVVLTKQTGTWRADVTLKHDDTGWEHYADAWRLVDAKGNELAKRVLYHPHVNEQPFTRSIHSFQLPQGIKIITVEAHDKKHGWSPSKVTINMKKTSGNKYKIQYR